MNSNLIIKEVLLPKFRADFDEILKKAIKQGKVDLKPSEVLPPSFVYYEYVNGVLRWTPMDHINEKLTKEVFDEIEAAWKALGLA